MENPSLSHSLLSRTRRPIRRVALACIQCRSRKVKCDATQPFCTRCQVDGKQCEYQKSRRGGRPRRPAPAPLQIAVEDLPSSSGSPCPWTQVFSATIESHSSSGTRSAGSSTQSISDTPEITSNLEAPKWDGMQLTNVQAEQLLDQYYIYFHVAHPCVLPRRSLRLRLAADTYVSEILIPVLLYIGSIFTHSIPSTPLAEAALQAIKSARSRGTSSNPYYVQALTLYSIAVYWCDEPERGRELLDEAIRIAVELGMHQGGFAAQYGHGDRVLEESWRRTWWQLYITDAHIAGSTHTYPTKTGKVPITVGLPCEEDYYESGVSY